MEPRIEAELNLLRLHYETVEYQQAPGLHWFLVKSLRTTEGWSPEAIPVVFSVTEGHPGTPPYGFFVPDHLTFRGTPPTETAAKNQPPFPGTWRFLSWQAMNWQMADDVRAGSNLWGWVRSFIHRLREGM